MKGAQRVRWIDLLGVVPTRMQGTEMGTPKMQLVLDVRAHFSWRDPPANKAEETMREHVDNMARAAIVRLEPAIRLLVMELITAGTTPNA